MKIPGSNFLCGFFIIASLMFVRQNKLVAQPEYHYMPSKIGWHEAVYDGNEKDPKLVPWTTWDNALEREMNWYLRAPVNEKGYPSYVHITFMDEKYQAYRNDFIPATQDGMGIKTEFKDEAPDARHSITGRLKMGTESNGGFRNITVSNCVFEHSRGICIETADGGLIEDVLINNITMRDVTDTPFFIRLNARMRDPEGTPVGVCRRITLSNINVYDVGGRPKFPEVGAGMVMGIPGHYFEDLTLSNIRIYYRAGASKEAIDKEVPQNIDMSGEWSRRYEIGKSGEERTLGIGSRRLDHPLPEASC